MLAVIVITHGDVGKSLVESLSIIAADHKLDISTQSIFPQDDMEKHRKALIKTVESYSKNSGVIILTDMFGGTPCNIAMSCLSKGKVEVIAGVNLPMLIKATTLSPNASFDQAVAAIHDIGRKSIQTASFLLADNTKIAS